ncbi:MAG: YicC family protein [Proteobacteria bacterium]|nr:MAG: YicC family protein [Pseudomonadota bacterium]
MIYSMTGYASSNLQINSISLQLELKSVNHRFIDISIKTNDEFKALENVIRTTLSEQIVRGKIDFKCFIKDSPQQSKKLILKHDLLEQYIQMIEQINQQTQNPAPISATDILALPGIFQQPDIDIDAIQPELISAINLLIDSYKATQASEGNKLRQVIQTRLDDIQTIIDSTLPQIKLVTAEYKEKLKQRLTEALDESNISDTRLQQEFAFFCQKIDIQEELDRLGAHVKEFNKLIAKGGAIGKRLDFICQEMNREANTFGSKSIAIEITQKAVDLKVLIEQIREQVQNIM